MTTVVLRKSLTGNWGLFQRGTIPAGSYYRYPKCECPDCTGRHHAKFEQWTKETWVAIRTC